MARFGMTGLAIAMSETDTEDESLSSEDVDDEDFNCTKQSVILFIDVDSFEVQVHGLDRGMSPEVLSTQPCIVVNNFGVITAVNYPAKEKGITRSKQCSSDVARQLCPNVQVLHIPTKYDKPDSLIAKRASDNIYDSLKNALKKHCRLPVILEKSSKDEFFIDVSDEVFRIVHVDGKLVPSKADIDKLTSNEKFYLETPYKRVSKDTLNYRASKVLTDSNIGLARHVTEAWLMHGASIVSKILADIQEQTQFVCSAGVSSNKLLAKLGCSRYKPKGITVFPYTSVPRVSKTIPLERLPGMAGKKGQLVQDKLRVTTMAQLARVNRTMLMKVLGIKGQGDTENNLNLNAIATGFDTTAVVNKSFSKSIQCGITFSHKTRKIKTQNDFLTHLENRFKEMREHLLYEYSRHKRIPISFRLEVKTRKRDFRTAFGETVEITPNLINKIKEERMTVNGHTNLTDFTPLLPLEWKQLYNNFSNKVCTDCKIKLFDPNQREAEAAVRKVSEIRLLAEFPIITE